MGREMKERERKKERKRSGREREGKGRTDKEKNKEKRMNSWVLSHLPIEKNQKQAAHPPVSLPYHNKGFYCKAMYFPALTHNTLAFSFHMMVHGWE